MHMKHRIIKAIDSPHELEILYRESPKEFTCAFPEVFQTHPASKTLMAWQERLFFEKGIAEDQPQSSLHLRPRDVLLTVVLSIIAGTIVKLPHFFPTLDGERFYSRNLGGIVVGALIFYFCRQKSAPVKTAISIFGFLFGALIYLNLLPTKLNSQTLILACMHMPFFFWSLLGLAFLGGAWTNMPGRMDYVRFNGELLIYSTIVLIGGMVLTGVTFVLFGLIDLKIHDWYMKNVVVYGTVASPIVATLLIDRVARARFRISPLIAKVFTPLFLVTVAAYLFAMLFMQRSPFTDRNFLIAFNVLLLVVLGLCVLSIFERNPTTSTQTIDILNTGLVTLTLIIDLVALAAIVFRLGSYGFTPNRLAVLGANLLVFCHLAGILYSYLWFIRGKAVIERLEKWIVGYIPVYTTWSIFVAIGFPLIFKFE